MKKFFSDRNLVLIIVIAGLLTRLLYLPVPFIINVADGAGYVAMADVALKGNWASFFDDYIYRTPIYPFFIALNKIVFGRFWQTGLAWVQHLLGIAVAVLVYFLGKKVFASRKTGFLAGFLTVTHAAPVYWEHNSMSDAFFTFMTVLTFYIFLVNLSPGEKKADLLFGFLFGLNLLTRPLFQLFWVVFPLLIFLFNRDWRKTLKRFLLIMGVAILVIAPWFFQNWYRHRFFGFSPFLGVQLMVRIQNYMDMASPKREAEKQVYLQTMIEQGGCDQEMIEKGTCPQVAVAGWVNLQKNLGLNQVEANQALQEISFEAIQKEPERYLRETWKEIKIFLTRHPRVNFFGDIDIDKDFRADYQRRMAAGDSLTIRHQKIVWSLTFKPVYFVILGIFGVILALWRRNKKAYLLVLLVGYMVSVTCAIEKGEVTRYRLPLEPFFFLFAAYFFDFLVQALFFNRFFRHVRSCRSN